MSYEHHASGFDVANEHDKSVIFWRAEMDLLDSDLKSKDRIEARVYDLYRNNDLMRGLIEKQIDFAVGSTVRLQSMPDYESLGVTEDEAREWGRQCARAFHNYVDSPENWVSSDRTMDWVQMIRSAERMRIMTGEIFASREWRRSPLGFSTCYQLISPKRVKSPSSTRARANDENSGSSAGSGNSSKVFHGIEMDRFNTPLAYYIESSRLDQRRSFSNKKITRYSKYNRFGWLQLYHIYEPLLPEYPRGITRLACVLKKIKGIDRYSEADLDKAIIAASYVYAITSDEDPESIADMLSGASNPKYAPNQYALENADQNIPQDVLDKREEILEDITTRYIETTGGQVVHLFKGESMEVVSPPQNQGSHSDYVKGHTKSVANGIGISYELGTGDFTGINFSAGQLSLGVHEHSAAIQRKLYIHKFARLLFRSWLDEAMDKGTLPLLGNQPYFPNREAYSKCEFSGSTQVQADPLKRARTDQAELDMGITSRSEIASRRGSSIEAITGQRANEAEMILDQIINVADKLGLDLSDEAKLKVLVDIMSTQKVTPPDLIIEGDGSSQE